MKDIELKHYILTPFNIGIYKHFRRISRHTGTFTPDSWMEWRINIFRNFTLPSVVNQTCQDFKWVIVLDSRTPKKYLDDITSIDYDNLVFKLVDSENPYGDTKIWNSTVPDGDFLSLSTRLENDDAIHQDFVKNTQKLCDQPFDKMIFIKPGFGYMFNMPRWELRYINYPDPTINSLAEMPGKHVSMNNFNHSRLPNHIKQRHLPQKPFWIINVHKGSWSQTWPKKGVLGGKTLIEEYSGKEVVLEKLKEFNISEF